MDHEGLGVLLLCDNHSSKKIAKKLEFHKRNNNIAIRYHFMQEEVENPKMVLKFVKTKAMAADQLNKNVSLQVLVARNDLMGMCSG